jgi:isopenicillin-N epimerase
MSLPAEEDWSRLWSLDPEIVFLNHGSFGACPLAILEVQRRYREQLEREPVRFFIRELEPLLDRAREAVSRFVGADAQDLVFVHNATTGVNVVLRSLRFSSGDELLVTDHAYRACRNSLEYAAERAGAKVVVAPLPFPISSEEVAINSVLSRVTQRTRLAMLDHITSPTAMVLPVERLVSELNRLGVDTLVDGAHAPGMVPLDLRSLNAAYYTGNCHKWLCSPKGAAFLHVRRDKQGEIVPLTISHGQSSRRTDRSRFRLQFDVTATGDPSAFLCVPESIAFLEKLLDGGWKALMARNRDAALTARETLRRSLQLPKPVPDSMIGSMAALPLPPIDGGGAASPNTLDPLQDELFKRFRIEVPVWSWPSPPVRLIRISAQLYNTAKQYEFLAEVLGQCRFLKMA